MSRHPSIRTWIRAVGALAIGFWVSPMGDAAVTSIEVQSVEPVEEGRAFGTVGAYERVTGVAWGAVDPAGPHNASIADLDLAPTNDAGRVGYRVPFVILQPVDPTRGRGVIFYDVTNRGTPVGVGLLNGISLAAGSGLGDALLLRRGYTIVWNAWEAEPARDPRMRVELPVATREGRPLTGRVRDEFVFGVFPTPIPDTATLSYAAVDLDPASARMSVRLRESDPPREIPSDGFAFVDDRHIRLLGGESFQRGAIYDFWYEARNSPVAGLGYAATRDLVSFLRAPTGSKNAVNPVTAAQSPGGVRAVLAFGVSQSGRFLRHFVELGMNRSEADTVVFDGALADIAGAGKVFANHRFAQPGRSAGQHANRRFPENWFPMSAASTTDPHTGRRGALLRGDGFDPRFIEVNSSTEYWHKGASLLHTDPLGKRDLVLPATARVFLIAGTEHAGGAFARADACVNGGNPQNPAPALRALFVALDEWVTEGKTPPASRVPALADGTLVRDAEFAFPVLPGVGVATAANRIPVPGDWVDPIEPEGLEYGVRVPQVDADGNEQGGLKLPPTAVPTGTYTGWNVFREGYPAGDLCGRSGSFVPFPPNRDAARRSGDPRTPLLDRYPSRDAYVKEVARASARLVEERLLIAEDAVAYVETARRFPGPWSEGVD